MKKIFLISFILLSSITVWANPSTVKGCIGVFQGTIPISIEVNLPPFKGGIFTTDLFRFTNLPKNMIPNEKGSYCYPMNDERFAFVHMYYYAVTELEDYKKIFNKLGLPLTIASQWKISKDTSGPTGGQYGLIGLITYPNLAVPDPSTIQHEVGHWMQTAAAGNNFDFGGPFGEGSANLLAALHSGDAIIGRSDSYSLAYNIDTFVQFPDHILTMLQLLKQVAQDPILNAKYPEMIKSVNSLISSGIIDPNFPNPYTTSSIINQPLWEASFQYGTDTIKILYIKTLSMLNENKEYSYGEIAGALIRNAQEMNPELAVFLQQEYDARGALQANIANSTSAKKISHRLMEIGLWK
jgi:hypothetical protein